MKKRRSNFRVFLKDGAIELLTEKQIPFSYRVWALAKGFFPRRAYFHGINKRNANDYLKDIDYYRNAPYNNVQHTSSISKENFKNTLMKYNEFTPQYYMKISGGKYERLQDCPKEITCGNANSVITLLEKRKILAIKKVSGRAGAGFIIAKHVGDDQFSFNDLFVNREKAIDYISNLDGYLFTEFIQQADVYKGIYENSIHTLRVQTYKKDKFTQGQIVFAFVRIGGEKASGAVGHVVSEGIYSTEIDIVTGEAIKTVTPGANVRLVEVENHPDTGKALNVAVPNWKLISKMCIEMHNTCLKDLCWLGWDIVATNEGFKILEINTFSGLVAPEAFEPIKTSEKYKRVFEELLKRKR